MHARVIAYPQVETSCFTLTKSHTDSWHYIETAFSSIIDIWRGKPITILLTHGVSCIDTELIAYFQINKWGDFLPYVKIPSHIYEYRYCDTVEVSLCLHIRRVYISVILRRKGFSIIKHWQTFCLSLICNGIYTGTRTDIEVRKNLTAMACIETESKRGAKVSDNKVISDVFSFIAECHASHYIEEATVADS